MKTKNDLRYWGKKVEEYYTITINDRRVRVKRTIHYDYKNKEKFKGSEEMISWELDDTEINKKVYEIINKEKRK